jgi:hypothetical protein
MFILISTLISWNLLHNFVFFGSGDIEKQLSSEFGEILFMVIASTSFVLGQYITLRLVNQVVKDIVKASPLSRFFKLMYGAIRVIQYTTAAILTVMILEMILSSHYNVVLLVAALSINFALLAVISGVMSFKFFSWFKINKSITVLLYGVAFSLFVLFGLLVSIMFSNIILSETKDNNVSL